MKQESLTGTIIGGAMRVHRALGPGYLESVYQAALALELSLQELAVERERRIEVCYRDVVVGTFVVDLLVAGAVLVETKATRALAPHDAAQVVNYLTATGLEIGLLINFGAERLQFRRLTRSGRERESMGSTSPVATPLPPVQPTPP